MCFLLCRYDYAQKEADQRCFTGFLYCWILSWCHCVLFIWCFKRWVPCVRRIIFQKCLTLWFYSLIYDTCSVVHVYLVGNTFWLMFIPLSTLLLELLFCTVIALDMKSKNTSIKHLECDCSKQSILNRFLEFY